MGAIFQQTRWTGETRGLFKNLSGFDKKRHTVPTAATPAAAAFLGKLCAESLREECEAFFQRARVALGYKRREISLTIEGGAALLEARDFTLEWEYSVAPEAPAEWILTRTLRNVRNSEFLRLAEFGGLFTGATGFGALEFWLEKPVRVEDVIDTVEALSPTDADANTALSVEYPSDCSRCVLRVAGVAAEVVFLGAVLRMEFPAQGEPAALADEFMRVREAFGLTKADVLAGLV
jgi:hypothetical protein